MAAVLEQKEIFKGGSFLIEDRTADEIFTPEDFNEEHRMIAETTRQFIDAEVVPRIDELENKDWKLARELIKQAADLGLIGAGIPEEYGGLGLDQTSGALIGENIGRSASFATTLGAESGIGLLPIIYFGTDAAKQKYLPKIASGELITAYALTEAGSGSDAMNAKATAKLSDDGTQYILNGEKMFITNGGFADIFIVFAKVDGDKFSAFIVERQEGCKHGAEEHKMGIRGSSTTPLILADARTPVENVLGEIGKGHKIAFNILNIGRFKLGAMCAGGMKVMNTESVRYANERQQFGKPISSFGAIKSKLGEMAIRTWVGESMIYRTLIPGRLMKAALSGRLALLPAAQALMDEILSPSMGSFDLDEGLLAAEQKLLKNAKKVALMTLGTAAQKYMMTLSDQQEILMGVADIIIDTYAMESAILRTLKMLGSQGEKAAALYTDMTRTFCNDAVERIEAHAKNTLAAMAEGDELRTLLAALRRFTKMTPMNTVAARQRIANAMIEANRYVYKVKRQKVVGEVCGFSPVVLAFHFCLFTFPL